MQMVSQMAAVLTQVVLTQMAAVLTQVAQPSTSYPIHCKTELVKVTFF